MYEILKSNLHMPATKDLTHAQTLNNLGTQLAQQGQFQTAIRYLEEAISARPDYNPSISCFLSKFWSRNG